MTQHDTQTRALPIDGLVTYVTPHQVLPGREPLFVVSMEMMHTPAQQGKFDGITPWQRWCDAIEHNAHSGCDVYNGDKGGFNNMFEVTEGRYVECCAVAWQINFGAIDQALDHNHYNVRIRNQCECADEQWGTEPFGLPKRCVNPQHLHVERTASYDRESGCWRVL